MALYSAMQRALGRRAIGDAIWGDGMLFDRSDKWSIRNVRLNASTPLNCADIANQIQKADLFVDLTDVNESHLEKYLLIEADDLASWLMRRDATRATPEMILVLEVKETADMAAIKQAVQEYHDEQIFQYRDYQPGQVFKLENAKVIENASFIILAVAPDASKVNAALGNGWK